MGGPNPDYDDGYDLSLSRSKITLFKTNWNSDCGRLAAHSRHFRPRLCNDVAFVGRLPGTATRKCFARGASSLRAAFPCADGGGLPRGGALHEELLLPCAQFSLAQREAPFDFTIAVFS